MITNLWTYICQSVELGQAIRFFCVLFIVGISPFILLRVADLVSRVRQGIRACRRNDDVPIDEREERWNRRADNSEEDWEASL